jgi:hypothetical protein
LFISIELCLNFLLGCVPFIFVVSPLLGCVTTSRLVDWCPLFWDCGGLRTLVTNQLVTWHHITGRQRS